MNDDTANTTVQKNPFLVGLEWTSSGLFALGGILWIVGTALANERYADPGDHAGMIQFGIDTVGLAVVVALAWAAVSALLWKPTDR